MFQRVIHHDWAALIPIISFIITAGFFIAISIRAMRLKKPEREHLANIPLEDGVDESKF
ncbi:MAG: hypothetical protein ACNA8L_11045 [Luteolibacter sp.]|jgi:hypothetical protein